MGFTQYQRRALHRLAVHGGVYAGPKTYRWLESVTGFRLQMEYVRGEGSCIYRMNGDDGQALSDKCRELLCSDLGTKKPTDPAAISRGANATTPPNPGHGEEK